MDAFAPHLVEKDLFIGDTAVSFDPQLELTEERKLRIVTWPVLRDKLEARQNDGFYISRLIVKGIASFGHDKDNPALILAEFRYTDTNAISSTYHGVFMPDGAALLEVFRLAGTEKTKARYYAKMVVQDRVVLNTPKCLEVPVGLIEEGETPIAGARREHKEETGASEEIGGEIMSLGSIAFHNLVADTVHLFLAVHDVTDKEFKMIQKEMLNKKGGLKEEGEETKVELWPLRKAYKEVYASGTSACTEIHLGRAMDYLKIPRPHAAFKKIAL